MAWARVRTRFLLVAGVAAMALAIACGRSGLGGLAPSGSPTPSPTPGGPGGFGNGQDGSPTFNTPQVVNACVAVVSAPAGGTTVQLATSPPAGATGRLFLLWQVQEDLATPSSITVDPVLSLGSAGLFEIVRATGAPANGLTVQAPLLGTYRSQGLARAQACSLPEYVSPTVATGGALLPAPWNGSTGGLVGFFANGVLTLTGSVDARGAGLRGGAPGTLSGLMNQTLMESSSAGIGGSKGEGLDGRALPLLGRGAIANAGGGGNDDCAGGGGGGGSAKGGDGGIDFQNNGNTYGYGGGGLSVGSATPPARLWLGAGGGGGSTHNTLGGPGGIGGGVVLIFAAAIRGTGGLLAGGGLGGAAVSTGDGAGGGGAGGTIALVTTAADSFTGNVLATGGAGTDQASGTGCGAGGGGGGGSILVGPNPARNAQCDASGGQAGANPKQATNGSNGTVHGCGGGGG